MLRILGSLASCRGRVGLNISEKVKGSQVSSSLRITSAESYYRIVAQPLSSQTKLPSLPVPPLQVTLDKFLRTVQPHVSEQEFCRTKELVETFLCPGGIGEKLQKLLEKRAKSTENWLADWWLNSAYLDFRYPVVVWSSPGLVFPNQPVNCQDEQIALAAKVTLAALDFKKIIDEDKLPLEKMGKDPLDMAQYKKIFGTCRMPGIKRDSISFADPCDPPKHVVVAYKNHFFEVPVYGDNNQPLSENQLICQLKEIVEEVEECTTPVGILTSEHRDAWGKAYQELAKDSQNLSSLKSIEKSLFLVCLDEPNPDLGDVNCQTVSAHEMVHGCGSQSNGGNRWFDKTIQFIIGTNGELGLTYEHSPAEGPPIAGVMDHVVNIVEKGGLKNSPSSSSPQPKQLPFNVSPSVECLIDTAGKNLDSLVDDLELYGFTYKEYGKEFPKSQKMSPDSFIQMAIQYAFYRIHKVPAAHYESAATRKYIHGRTETIRSCSIESVAFAKAMLDPAKSNKEKVATLVEAVNSHKKYTQEAVQGFGVDRHLLGLKLIALENGIEVPELYQDPGYVKSAHMRISSSQVAGKCNSFMCYGPLTMDGYSCCYNPRPNDIIMGVAAFRSCQETSAAKFRDALQQSFNDMRDVLLKTQKAKL